ncbi:MAG: NAD(P)-binding protein, partial [Streptomyces sp.]|nr:NAD(P)-binding protein [Streptomyces sp.]
MTENGDSTTPRAHGHVTRRTVLKAAGATALAAGAVTATGSSAAAADGKPYDAIVVGAGYAGGTVARELGARGMKVLVLEARGRIGGRIEPGTLAGQHIELGGGWFGPGQDLVARELKRYSLTTTEDVHATRMVMPGPDGYASHSPQEAGARLNSLFADFYAGSEQYFERPYEPLHRKDLLASVDRLSLADRIAQLQLSGVDHDWVSGATSVFAGGNRTGSLTGLAQWYQLAGGTYDKFL